MYDKITVAIFTRVKCKQRMQNRNAGAQRAVSDTVSYFNDEAKQRIV